MVSKLGSWFTAIKRYAIIVPVALFMPAISFAEYYFVYPGPGPCFRCHRVVHPCRRKRHVVRRVHRVRRPCCGTVSVHYVVPVAPACWSWNQGCGGSCCNEWAYDFPPSGGGCYNNNCYRYNPDMSTGDDQVLDYPDMDSQY